MKRLVWIAAILLIAAPVFAQEEGGGGGGLPSSLFGGADFGNRNEQPKPMDAVKKFFAQANVTLSGDEEKAMKPIVEAAFKQVQDTVERLSPPADAAGRGQGGGRQGGGQGGERRGGGGFDGQRRGGRGGGGQNNPQLTAELQKINDEILPKITAAMKPANQAAFKKWQNDQVKKAGGFAALKLNMEEAGAALTAEQEPQILALYTEDGQQRRQLQREGQGTADPAKVADLEKATMAKVVKLLTPAQRKALLDSRTKQ
jgi:hypothetical protein